MAATLTLAWPQERWFLMRGHCSICDHNTSTDFRDITEYNRENINKFFGMNIQTGSICFSCFSEYDRYRKEYPASPIPPPPPAEEQKEPEVKVEPMPPVIPEIIEKPKEKLGVKRKPVNQNPAPPKNAKVARQKESHTSATAKTESKPEAKEPTKPEKVKTEKQRDFSYLNSMKVSDIQLQLKKYNASTKGSKAQLIQQLVRYMCLFDNVVNTAPPATKDLSYLSGMKVSELQDQLRKHNAPTKGSKAELVQRLVRYMFLFSNGSNAQAPSPPTKIVHSKITTPPVVTTTNSTIAHSEMSPNAPGVVHGVPAKSTYQMINAKIRHSQQAMQQNQMQPSMSHLITQHAQQVRSQLTSHPAHQALNHHPMSPNQHIANPNAITHQAYVQYQTVPRVQASVTMTSPKPQQPPQTSPQVPRTANSTVPQQHQSPVLVQVRNQPQYYYGHVGIPQQATAQVHMVQAGHATSPSTMIVPQNGHVTSQSRVMVSQMPRSVATPPNNPQARTSPIAQPLPMQSYSQVSPMQEQGIPNVIGTPMAIVHSVQQQPQNRTPTT